ncbi:MAG: hypothetical protein L6V93_15755 [Clostridiales bacterium]|nr:MAG: hypothetical protein L6V93_15755 [Clostridiales bacterium]
MTAVLIMASVVIFACVLFNRLSINVGIPALLAFILLGMFFGSDGVVRIPFDDYIFAERICSVALIFHYVLRRIRHKYEFCAPLFLQKAVLLSSFGTFF